MSWDLIATVWGYVDWCLGALAFVAASFAFGISVANMFRLNRMDADRVTVDERLYALEDDAGIGPGGSWAQRAVERTRH